MVEDRDIASKSLSAHRTLAPWMFLFMATGFSSGVLSLVMHHQHILESPHFWTGSIVLLLLLINRAITFTTFSKNKLLRTVHTYLGSTALRL